MVRIDETHFFHILSSRRRSPEFADLDEREKFLVDFCAKREILRLRSLKGPHDYLLRLRAEAIANSPRMIRVMVKRREQHEATGKTWSLTHYYHSQDGFHKSYINAVPREEARRLKAIPSGIIPITEANAACIASLTGHVVVASETLRHFYYFMTIAVFGANFDIAFADRINAVLIAFRIMNEAESQDFDLDSRGTLPPRVEASLQALVHDQMQFTFGHEYAHFLAGHTSTENVVMPGGNFDARVFAHEFEFEADANAIGLLKHNRVNANRIATAGLSVLGFLSLLYRLKGQYGLKPLPVSDTHPIPLDRLRSLKTRLHADHLAVHVDVDELLSVCDQLAEAFPYLLESVEQPNPLTFYGSIYLPTYMTRIKRDRVDF